MGTHVSFISRTYTLPETGVAPENGPSQNETIVFQPSIFRVELLNFRGFYPIFLSIKTLPFFMAFHGVQRLEVTYPPDPFWMFFRTSRFGGIICKFPGGFFLTIPIPHTKKNNPRGTKQQEECAALVMFCLFQVSVDETDAFVLGVYCSFFDFFWLWK